jgi:hypothetical protein
MRGAHSASDGYFYVYKLESHVRPENGVFLPHRKFAGAPQPQKLTSGCACAVAGAPGDSEAPARPPDVDPDSS